MSSSNSFTVVCGSATLDAPVIDEPAIYVIDGNRPILEVPRFVTHSPEDCEISRYEIYSGPEELSPYFDQDPVDLGLPDGHL